MQTQINFLPLQDGPGTRRLKLTSFGVGLIGLILLFTYKYSLKLYLAGWGLIVLSALPNFLYLGKEKKQWRAFAAANNWEILPKKAGKDLVPPSIDNEGHSHKNGEVIVGKVNGFDFKLLKCSFTTGFGKNQQVTNWAVLAMASPAASLHWQLVHHGLISDMVKIFKDSQKIELEGDFGKIFNLFIPQNMQIDALSIFTPDIMMALIKDAQPFDIEALDGWVYFCLLEATGTRGLELLFENSQLITGEFQKNYKLSHNIT